MADTSSKDGRDVDQSGSTIGEVADGITAGILKESRAARFQNAQLREAMKKAGLEPPNEDPNYDALVTAIEGMQAKDDSIAGKEGAFKAEVYRDAATYAFAAKRRGDVRYNEACDAIMQTLLQVASEHEPKEVA